MSDIGALQTACKHIVEKLLKYCVLFCSWLSKQACKYSESCVFECEKDHQCPVSDIGALLFVLQNSLAIAIESKTSRALTFE